LEGGLLLSLYVLYIVDNVLPRTNLSSWSDEFRLVMLCLVLPVVMITIITQAAVYWRTSR
jgi:cation:H+ antiporter